MIYFFLGLGGIWAISGVMQLFESWGQVDGMRSALGSLLMAVVNVAVAWFLYWRNQRRAGTGR